MLRKVNVFPATVSDNGPEALQKGLMKTTVYSVMMIVASVVVMLRYSRPNSIVVTINNPTPADYAKAATLSNTVTCPCTVTSMPLSDVASLSLSLAGWCNRPANVTFISQYQEFCAQNPNSVVPGTNIAYCPPNTGAAAMVDKFCAFYDSVLVGQLAQWNSTAIFTPTALSPSGLQGAANTQMSSFRSSLALNLKTSFELVTMYEQYVRPITGFGYHATAMLIAGKTDPTAVGCNVEGCYNVGEATYAELGADYTNDYNFLDATASAPHPELVYVLTRKGNFPFDTSVDNWGGGNCEDDYNAVPNIACSGFQFYLRTDFNSPRVSQYALLPVKAFNMTGSMADSGTTGLINNASVATTWATYFNQCAPKTCSYTVAGEASVSELIVVVLGVLGGLAATLKSVAGALVDGCLVIASKLGGKSPSAGAGIQLGKTSTDGATVITDFTAVTLNPVQGSTQTVQ